MAYTGSEQGIQARINLLHRRNKSFTIIVVSETEEWCWLKVELLARFAHCEVCVVCLIAKMDVKVARFANQAL